MLNFIPARLSALFLLAAGAILGLDSKNGWRIFRRDRYRHASPNSAQTESVCAGLLGLRLVAGRRVRAPRVNAADDGRRISATSAAPLSRTISRAPAG